MTESSVTMSSAARELEERRKELATCMAELEDAQTTALADDALASKVLTVRILRWMMSPLRLRIPPSTRFGSHILFALGLSLQFNSE